MPPSAVRRPLRVRLTPLAAALAGLLPPLAAHAAGPVIVPPPAANAVPVKVPGLGWRVYGTGNNAPFNQPNSHGGIDQTITQTSQKGIYNWQSFNIGSASSVTFDMALPGSSALNRVTGTGPSQIFGQLKATNNGEIYLINANGILFGRGAVVNTGSLIASGLDITDDNFKASLVPSITANNQTDAAAFRYQGDPGNFVDGKNYVRVDEGATIATGSGGRVFLFAKKVDNAGTITTPDGQTALAAGSEVFLRLPTENLKVYASEQNPEVPALRGLLVDVGDVFDKRTDVPATAHLGSVTNAETGVVSAPRGNATLVGLAVNQLGRVSATTSVSENGSIFLRAQGNAAFVALGGGNAFGLAPQSQGALTLGPDSRTEVLPDTTLADGKVPTSDGNATFVGSRIDLLGESVHLQSNASVFAPGATVNVRAVSQSGGLFESPATVDASARIVMDTDARIDVSGTTGTVVGVDRYFVDTDLLTSSDLQDAPLQKNGLLYRAKVTVDVREDSKILGDLARYRNALQQTVEERLSGGGHVNMAAQGAVLLAQGSSVDVSGGRILTTSAMVDPTRLVASNGAVYSLNDAPADQLYAMGLNLQKASLTQYDRWGALANPGASTPATLELGYTQGQAAGSLSIDAPSIVMAGSLAAHTVVGERQAAGLDPLAAAGRLVIGNPQAYGSYDNPKVNPTESPLLLGDFTIGARPQAPASLWANPLTDDLPEHSGVAMATVVDAGFGDITVAAEGDVTFGAGGGVRLADHTRLTLDTVTGDALLVGKVADHAGSISLSSTLGRALVGVGARIDLSGRWINQFVDGTPEDTSAIAGGSFSAQGERGVTLSAGSLVDVSGGAAVGMSGTLSGGNAGSVALLAGRSGAGSVDGDAVATRKLTLEGTVRGEALQSATGGSLALRAPSLRIGDAPPGADAAALTLAPDFFTRGGFSSYSVEGLVFADVAPGTHVSPTRDAWWPADTGWQRTGTGASLPTIFASGRSPLLPPAPVSVAILSNGTTSVTETPGWTVRDGGELTIGAAAVFTMVPGSTFTAQAAARLDFEGRIVDHGGKVVLNTSGLGKAGEPNYLWLGDGSSIDVSGTTVLTPSTDGLRHGVVQDGGSVTLAAPTVAQYGGAGHIGTSLVIQDGARLDLDGTRDTLDIAVRNPGGTTLASQAVVTHGGTLNIVGTSDLVLEGDVSMRGGDASAAGGSINITLLGSRDAFASELTPAVPPVLTLSQARTHGTRSSTPDSLPTPQDIATRNLAGQSNADVSADWVKASGAADLELDAWQVLHVSGDVQLAMPRNLVLHANALSADDGARSRLAGAVVAFSSQLPVAEPNNSLTATPRAQATAGTGALELSGQDMVIDGRAVTQGIETLTLTAAHDLRLQATAVTDKSAGSITSAGDIVLAAGQIYPGTAQTFTISAPDHAVTIKGGDASLPLPLSAGGKLEIAADRIVQGGVVRAPFGSISLAATDSLALTAGSSTSVSGSGLTVSYGNTQNDGSIWNAPADTTTGIPSLPSKSLSLQSSSIKTDAGAVVDVSGGGNVVAYEFVAGPGGSRNVFAGGDGAYALVPGRQGLAGFDPVTAGAAGVDPVLGQQIIIGAGAPVPAGRYTLMAARYALLPGAFLVKPADGTSLAFGTTIVNPDGSSLVGARTASANTTFSSSTSSTWSVQTREQALTHSEIHVANADTFFAAQAASKDQAAPRGPADGGVFQVVAGSADVLGTFKFDAARDAGGNPAGLGGVASFSADHIVVGSARSVPEEGTLTLSASQLSAMAPATLLLGATLGAGTASNTLSVSARDVRFENSDQALTVGDVVAAATDAVTVTAGASIVAAPPPSTGPAAPPAAPLTVAGDGAALRVDNQAGTTLTRTGVVKAAGTLVVGDKARLDAGAGSLLLDATLSNTVARTATLHADDIALGAPKIIVGNASAPGSLDLGDALLGQVDNASHLTLRGYDSISFRDGAQIAGDRLRSVTLDSIRLLAVDARAAVTAGEITLANSTGASISNTLFDQGELTLHASAAQGSGRILIGDGSVAVSGARSTLLQADRALVLAGDGTLNVSGSLVVRAPRVLARNPVEGSASVADVTFNANGSVEFLPGGPHQAADTDPSAPGAALTVHGARIQQGAVIDLPSGKVEFTATSSTSGDVTFTPGSITNLAGATRTIDGQDIAGSGGTLAASARLGNVVLQGGSTIDVSGAGDSGGGKAGFTAVAGTVDLGGSLRGSTTANAATGAQLVVDALDAPGLDQIAAIQAQAPGNFAGALDLRERGEGSLSLSSGHTLRAGVVSIDADAGAVAIGGRLDAGGRSAGIVSIAARDDVTLQPGSVVSVHATGDVAQGGRVELSSSQGRVTLAGGAQVDLSNDATATNRDALGGRLTLRAAQMADGHEVNIDPVGAQVTGAASIDVEAVKVYDNILHLSSDDFDQSEGTLHQSDIARDSAAFLGGRGQNANAIAKRLAAGNASLLKNIRVHAEAEVRSTGNLDFTTDGLAVGSDDFVLPTESVDLAATSTHVGDTSLTLRAVGNIRDTRTISAGFAPVYYGADERDTLRTSNHSGNIRIAAGADLGAADAMRTVAGHGKLDVGRTDQPKVLFDDAFNIVAVRATTGDVRLAAGANIDLRPRTLVYTVGADVEDDTTVAVRALENPTSGTFAFNTGAGAVSVKAGGSVLSNDIFVDTPLSTAFAEELSNFRGPIDHQAGSFGPPPEIDGAPTIVDAWVNWVRASTSEQRAQHGIVSFGGGRVDIAAGQDIFDVAALSPSSGYVLTDPTTGASTTKIFGGGDVHVQAGRDIVNGLYESGGRQMTVVAGRDIAWRAVANPLVQEPGVRLVTENAAVDATARRNLTLGNTQAAFWTQGTALTGLDADASVSALANGGDAALLGSQEFSAFGSFSDTVVPARLSILAPQGDVALGSAAGGAANGEIDQAPTRTSRLDLIAGGSVVSEVGNGILNWNVAAAPDASQGPQYLPSVGFQSAPLAQDAGLDHSDRTPVHIAAAEGDVQLGDFLTARPIRVSAGEDVTLLGSLEITHQPERLDGPVPVRTSETSSIQAGRDIVLKRSNFESFGVSFVNGGGNLLLLAGRDIDLGHGNAGNGDIGASGIVAAGNTRNALLPAGGADLTLVAGLRADGSDYDQAMLAGFEALGANALTNHAGDLYAQLTSTTAGSVALGSSAAQAFNAQGLDQQLAQVRDLIGSATYDARLAAYVREQPGRAGLSDAQALAAFAALPPDQRTAAPGVLLAPSFAAQPQATRIGLVSEIAAATPTLTYDDSLIAYMKARDGHARSFEQAMADFEALPQAARIPLLDAVLVSEVRDSGRAAAGSTGSVQQAAYDRGYRTISALFPADRPEGGIEMPEAVVKTLQQGSVTLMTPGGGVDAGGVSASEIQPSNLGIVTVTGGDIASIVQDDFSVNRSRVFTLAEGNVLIWSSEGNIDAGRGAKTVVGSPPPALRIDRFGHLFLDTSGSFTGSGIAVLDAKSDLDLYAPVGAIDAGEAGIRSVGNAFFAAQTFIGTDNLSVGGQSVGAPPAVSAVGATAGLANATNVLANAANTASDEEREERRKRRNRRNLLLEFLGFGSAPN